MIEAKERFADIDVGCQINNLAPNEMLMKNAGISVSVSSTAKLCGASTRLHPADCISPRFARFLNL